jgi:hypothetical protein
MQPIVMLMLGIQAAMLLVTILIVAIRIPTTRRAESSWSSIAISLLAVGIASSRIAADHDRGSGAGLLGFIGAMLVGMAVMAALSLFRERRQMAQRRIP